MKSKTPPVASMFVQKTPPVASMFVQNLVENFEVCHPRFVGSITKNFVYYTYSRTQLYFT